LQNNLIIRLIALIYHKLFYNFRAAFVFHHPTKFINKK
jgi:hypothetical protein